MKPVAKATLRALINSLTPEADDKMSPALAEKLSKKMGELMGTEALADLAQNPSRGELLNEEGLPIIDITEPVPISGADAGGAAAPLTERLRRERELILDTLEEEERAEAQKEREALRAHTEEMLRARREAATAEKERLKAAREVQKKMGKALMRGLTEARQKEEQAHAEVVAAEEKQEKRGGVQTTPTKKVAFADAPEEISLEREAGAQAHEAVDSGDVVLARLRSAQRPTLISNASLDRNPMKMQVVERVPGSQPFVDLNQGDSDDESEPPTSPVDDADGGSVWPSIGRSTSPPPPESDEDSTANSSLAEGEIDLEFAHHQREIALEYQKKRALVHPASSIVDAHQEDEYASGEAEMPTSDLPKPAVSRFKASRIASSYTDSPSTSSSSHTAPSNTHTIQKAIHRGKLDADGQLVAGDNSDDEDHGELQEIMELLAKGEIYNLGPDGNLIVPPPTMPKLSIPVIDQQPAAGPSALPPLTKPKTSRFKLARGQAGRSQIPLTPASEDSRSTTPISNATRSSPKSHSPPDGPIAGISSAATPSAFILPPTPGASFPSMVVESPSFPKPSTPRASAAPPAVIASPSFPDPSASRRPTRPPAVLSSVRETRSPAPASTAAEQDEPAKKMSRFMSERS
ncbi:hypothetical protein BD779DRAFT_1468886 [Infundibulicybe gibba]|nr:hypothetical protein BD779DRAFT_1468886 [Infundibulicybe gibba]